MVVIPFRIEFEFYLTEFLLFSSF